MSKVRNLVYHLVQSTKWYLRRRLSSAKDWKTPTHILFCMVDHYEPGTGRVPEHVERARVDRLLDEYPKLVQDHRDSTDRWPRRTWFFPPHYHRFGNLAKLVALCADGYGEIELHLHHGKQAPDTEQNLEDTVRECVRDYSQFGIFGEQRGRKRYGFIHGDSALANSRGGSYCGVDNEIDVLIRTGCYADFTHPSGPQTSPSLSNAIYYTEPRAVAKSYATGFPSKIGARSPTPGLMIVQGPSHPAFIANEFGWLRITGDHVPDDRVATNPGRVRRWVQSGVTLEGCDDAIFIKVATHGAPYADSVLGQDARTIFSELEQHFNDGSSFKLHYVTAREMYNVARALEDQRTATEIAHSLDYEISRPTYDRSQLRESALPKLQELVARTYRG